MTNERIIQIFDANTANGCRELNEVRFLQIVREVLQEESSDFDEVFAEAERQGWVFNGKVWRADGYRERTTPELIEYIRKFRPKAAIAPRPPEWWKDLYTDASGNCFSDADSGL